MHSDVSRPVRMKSFGLRYSPAPIMAAATVTEEKGNIVATLQANPTERQAATGWNP